MSKGARFRLLLFALCMICSGGAKAACLGVMNVSATLLNFNAYNPLSGSDKDAENTINVTCNLIVGIGLLPSFTVKLGPGTSNSLPSRQLASGSNKLNYNLFKDSGHSIVWGDGNNSTSTVSYSALLGLGTIPLTVYGRIFMGQDRPPGNYSDSILVTVEF